MPDLYPCNTSKLLVASPTGEGTTGATPLRVHQSPMAENPPATLDSSQGAASALWFVF
ncbi:MAG: hypothetical protein PUQ00_08320 [Nostoc sp. S13]|nr:hypothetical protein [Nostoc sp. S13]